MKNGENSPIAYGMRYACLRMNQESVSKERSWLMGIAMVMVILFHQPFLTDWFSDFFHAMGDRGVDIFFFLSGMGIYHSLSHHSLSRYLSNRFWRIVPAVVIAGLLEFALEGFTGSISQCMFGGKWFVNAIVVFYLLAPVIYRLINRNKIVLFSIITLVCLGQYLLFAAFPHLIKVVPLPSSLSFSFSYLAIPRFPAFVLGMLLAAEPRLVFGRIHPILTIILFAACYILTCGYLPAVDVFCLNSMPSIRASVSFLFLPCLPTLTHWLVVLGSQARKLSILHACIVFFGTYSLEIYLIHEYLFAKIFWMREWTGGCVCLLGAILASCAIAWCIKHWSQTIRKIVKC